jgi:hypothetical protein
MASFGVQFPKATIHNAATGRRLSLGRRLKEGGQGLLKLSRVKGLTEDAAPGGGMGHRGTREAEERSEVRSAQLGPRGESFEAALTSELGDEGNHEQRGKRIALAAGAAAVRDGGKVVGETLKAEGKGQVSGERQAGQGCGRVHRAPPERLRRVR